MRISLLAALAAATALVPVAAQAQNQQDRDWHGNHDNGRGDHAAPARSAPAATPRTQTNGGLHGAPDRGGWQGQAERPQPAQARPDAGSWHESVNTDRGNAGWRGAEAQPQNRSDWRGADTANRGNWQQGRDDPRGNWQQGRNDPRGAGNGGRDWNRGGQDWRSNGGYADRYRGNQAYNRGWRQDNRYDWRDYRAQNRGIYHLPRYYAPYGGGYGYRRFGVGFTLDSVLFGSNYWIGDPWAYRLPPAYGPYRWVRYYDDALLVDIRTGIVVDVVYDIFW